MFSVRLNKELDDRLERLSVKSGRSKSFFINKALEKSIDFFEDLEDLYDYNIAMKNFNNDDYMSLDDVIKQLGYKKDSNGKLVPPYDKEAGSKGIAKAPRKRAK